VRGGLQKRSKEDKKKPKGWGARQERNEGEIETRTKGLAKKGVWPDHGQGLHSTRRIEKNAGRSWKKEFERETLYERKKDVEN